MPFRIQGVRWVPGINLEKSIRAKVSNIDEIDRFYVSIPEHDTTDIEKLAVLIERAKSALKTDIWVVSTFRSRRNRMY